MTQVITIDEDGIPSCIDTKGGIDLRELGHVSKKRVSIIEFCEVHQMHFVIFYFVGDGGTPKVLDRHLWEMARGEPGLPLGATIAPSDVYTDLPALPGAYSEVILADSYELAVALEVETLNHLRQKTGKSYAEVTRPQTPSKYEVAEMTEAEERYRRRQERKREPPAHGFRQREPDRHMGSDE